MTITPMNQDQHSLKTTILHGMTLTAFVAVFFWPSIAQRQVFSFRDAGHYYFRLFEWNDAELREGKVPIWNPWENLGVPQMADATSSLFYPGKILLHLPTLEFDIRYNLYVVAHILLAAIGTWFAAKRMNRSPTSCLVAALSFAFGGILLTQVGNVVFLVGGSWLPWAIHSLLVMDRNRLKFSLTFSLQLAMMVLGGDPQIAFHTVLIALGYCWFKVGSLPDLLPTQTGERRRRLVGQFLSVARAYSKNAKWIVGASSFAILLAAVQVIPSYEWSRRSSRATYELPRSVYESVGYVRREIDRQPNDWPRYVPSGILNGIVGDPAPGEHEDHAYQFSVPPWTLAEVCYPNIGGQMFPSHQRWMNSLPGADRVWHPTMYVGTIPIILALSAFGLTSGTFLNRWMSWVLLSAILASVGWFGLGWLLRETMSLSTGAPPDAFRVGSPVGGLYWFLVTFVPAYAQFRYPAKWMVIAALMIALLAAYAFDELTVNWIRKKVVIVFSALTLVGLVTSFLVASPFERYLNDQPADPLFGPLDASAAIWNIQSSLLQSSICLALLMATVRFASQRAAWPKWLLVTLALGTAVDLWIANRWVVETVDHSVLERELEIDRQVTNFHSNGDAKRFYRGDLFGWLPSSFKLQNSDQRSQDAVTWDRLTLFPKHHLPHRIGLAESYSSIAAADFDILMSYARMYGPASVDGTVELPAPMLDLMSVEWLLVPDGMIWDDVESSDIEERTEFDSVQWIKRDSSFPRAWIVREYVKADAPEWNSLNEHVERCEACLFDDSGEWRDFRTSAYIETNKELPSLNLNGAGGEDHETCEYSRYSPLATELELSLQSEACIILNDYYDPGWQATLISNDKSTRRSIDVHRANRIMRCVFVPEGEWTLRFEYRPTSLRLGLVGSSVGIVIWIVGLTCLLIRWRPWSEAKHAQ